MHISLMQDNHNTTFVEKGWHAALETLRILYPPGSMWVRVGAVEFCFHGRSWRRFKAQRKSKKKVCDGFLRPEKAWLCWLFLQRKPLTNQKGSLLTVLVSSKKVHTGRVRHSASWNGISYMVLHYEQVVTWGSGWSRSNTKTWPWNSTCHDLLQIPATLTASWLEGYLFSRWSFHV